MAKTAKQVGRKSAKPTAKSATRSARKKSAAKSATRSARKPSATYTPRVQRKVITLKHKGEKLKVHHMGVTTDPRTKAKLNRYRIIDTGRIIHQKATGATKSTAKKTAPKKAVKKAVKKAPVKKAAPVKKKAQ